MGTGTCYLSGATKIYFRMNVEAGVVEDAMMAVDNDQYITSECKGDICNLRLFENHLQVLKNLWIWRITDIGSLWRGC